VEQVFEFGDTRIVQTTDGRLNRQYPQFTFQVFSKGILQAQVRNVSFEHFAASADGTLLVGLSNRGIPGSAAIVFNNRGAISLLATHGLAEFDYCSKSISIFRQWYDPEGPQINIDTGPGSVGTSGITLRDCKGKTVDLADAVLKAYGSSRALTVAQSKKARRSKR
jgi:hypothetical protein